MRGDPATGSFRLYPPKIGEGKVRTPFVTAIEVAERLPVTQNKKLSHISPLSPYFGGCPATRIPHRLAPCLPDYDATPPATCAACRLPTARLPLWHN